MPGQRIPTVAAALAVVTSIAAAPAMPVTSDEGEQSCAFVEVLELDTKKIGPDANGSATNNGCSES